MTLYTVHLYREMRLTFERVEADTPEAAAAIARDLIQNTPLVYDADGLPVGYDAQQLFGLEAAYLAGRL